MLKKNQGWTTIASYPPRVQSAIAEGDVLQGVVDEVLQPLGHIELSVIDRLQQRPLCAADRSRRDLPHEVRCLRQPEVAVVVDDVRHSCVGEERRVARRVVFSRPDLLVEDEQAVHLLAIQRTLAEQTGPQGPQIGVVDGAHFGDFGDDLIEALGTGGNHVNIFPLVSVFL